MNENASILSKQRGMTRKSFLSYIVMGWFIMLISPIFYGVIKYIIPPKFREKIIEMLDVGRVTDVPANSAKIIKFNKTPIVLVRTQDHQIKAYSAVCTHLGCIVQYREDERNFHCNCHGSVFDLNGKNIAGPAPRPLQPFRVEVKQDEIIIHKS